MAELDSRKVEQCLLGKLGCERRNNDHRYFNLVVEGQVVAFTKVSHGGSGIHDNLIGAMARQLGVSRRTFLGAVACSVDKAQFIREATSRT